MGDVAVGFSFRTWIKKYPYCVAILRLGRRGLTASLYLLALPYDVASLLIAIAFLRWFAKGRIPAKSVADPNALIVMLVWSYLPADPRVEREAKALARRGYRIKIICPQWFQEAPSPDWGEGIEVRYIRHSAARPLLRFPWLLSNGMLAAALAEKAWAFHAHDLNTALPAMIAAAWKRVLCVCDFHEWYSENASFDEARQVYQPHSPIKRWLFRLVEGLVLRKSSRVVTVCDSIALELEKDYESPRQVVVVRNIPPMRIVSHATAPSVGLRKELGISDAKAIVLYQGGLGPSRGIESFIAAMAIVKHANLVIRGPSMEVFAEHYRKVARQFGVEDSVYLLGPVVSSKCVEAAAAADIGIWTLMPICKNFTYALPNKLFEYLAASLPVVCAHHSEVVSIVSGFNVGRCFDPENIESIARAIDALAGDAILRRKCRENIQVALDTLNADAEWGKLIDLYDELGGAMRSQLLDIAQKAA